MGRRWGRALATCASALLNPFATSIPSSAPCKISCVHLNFHDPTSIQPVLLWVIGMSEDISAHHAPLIPLFFSLPSRQCLALRPSDSFLRPCGRTKHQRPGSNLFSKISVWYCGREYHAPTNFAFGLTAFVFGEAICLEAGASGGGRPAVRYATAWRLPSRALASAKWPGARCERWDPRTRPSCCLRGSARAAPKTRKPCRRRL